MNITTTYSATGQGPLKAGDLREVLGELPDDAVVTVKTYDDQRDGSGWTIIATARPGTRPSKILSGHIYAPGTR